MSKLLRKVIGFVWIASFAAACNCSAANPAAHGGVNTQASAPLAHGWIVGTVEQDSCAADPCPYARPPLPLRARVTARSISKRGHRRRVTGPQVTSSDGQGRFRLRVPADVYEVRAEPHQQRLRCRTRQVSVRPRRTSRVLIICR